MKGRGLAGAEPTLGGDRKAVGVAMWGRDRGGASLMAMGGAPRGGAGPKGRLGIEAKASGVRMA